MGFFLAAGSLDLPHQNWASYIFLTGCSCTSIVKVNYKFILLKIYFNPILSFTSMVAFSPSWLFLFFFFSNLYNPQSIYDLEIMVVKSVIIFLLCIKICKSLTYSWLGDHGSKSATVLLLHLDKPKPNFIQCN